MTIGIAVSGPMAGSAAFEALRAVECVGRGAIGGFVSLAVVDSNGRLVRAETQRGGTKTLFVDGETTGVLPPPEIAEARLAVLMSSGPDRPEPLAQFTPSDAGVGLVTGHRLPNMPGAEGEAINALVLKYMTGGATPEHAIRRALESNQDADVGVIALSCAGEIHLANSALVSARPDTGKAIVRDHERGIAVAILHNAIHPHRGLADLAAAVAIDRIAPMDLHDFEVRIQAGLRLELGDENCLFIDNVNHVARMTVVQSRWIASECHGAAVGLAAAVRHEGVLVGRTVSEPYCVAQNGRLLSVSGHATAPVLVRRVVP